MAAPTIAELIARVQAAESPEDSAAYHEATCALSARLSEAVAWLEAHWNDAVGVEEQDEQWIAILKKVEAGQKLLWDETISTRSALRVAPKNSASASKNTSNTSTGPTPSSQLSLIP